MAAAMAFLNQNLKLMPPRGSLRDKEDENDEGEGEGEHNGANSRLPEPTEEEVEQQPMPEIEMEPENESEPETELQAEVEAAPVNTRQSVVDFRHSQIKAQKRQDQENFGPQSSARGFRQPPRFIDRQEDAERVGWETQLPVSLPWSNGARATSSKRPAPPDTEDPNDEEMDDLDDVGFQEDDRMVDVEARRRTMPEQKPRQRTKIGRGTPKRAKLQEVQPRIDAEDSEEETQSNRQASHREPQMGNRSEPRNQPPARSQPPSTDYARVQEMARATTALHRQKNPKPQHRVKWTDQETEALIKYIEEYGCSWAQIKRADGEWVTNQDSGEQVWKGQGLLRDRGQVHLKDKARNMRFDYEKNGFTLPHGFENVTLSKSHIEKLAEMGLRP